MESITLTDKALFWEMEKKEECIHYYDTDIEYIQ
jgi:hypothetical protein